MMTNEDFIRGWQAAQSFEEFIAAHGLTKEHARNRAMRLRKHGVPLKSFPRAKHKSGPRATDWDALKTLAVESLPTVVTAPSE